MDIMQHLAAFILTMCLILQRFASFAQPAIIRKVYTMCRDTDIDILSVTGVKLEPYERSLVELPFPDSFVNQTDTLRFEFSFKTTSPGGVLFYTRNTHYPTEILAFYLRHGQLHYKITCPTLAAVDLLETRHGEPLNDGRWHNITFSVKFPERHRAQGANTTIDGYSTQNKDYPVSCHRVTSVIMGGARKEDLQYMHQMKKVKEHFEGCIRNVKANLPLRSPPKYSAVSICD
ncbi:hypothetical protein Btru_011658 [Bulinus truncatus]|nr:hypothetical protein Btru_011658 [Bulinus truncatus]